MNASTSLAGRWLMPPAATRPPPLGYYAQARRRCAGCLWGTYADYQAGVGAAAEDGVGFVRVGFGQAVGEYAGDTPMPIFPPAVETAAWAVALWLQLAEMGVVVGVAGGQCGECRCGGEKSDGEDIRLHGAIQLFRRVAQIADRFAIGVMVQQFAPSWRS